MAGRVLQAEQVRPVVDVRDRDIHVSVVVEVRERRAAARLRRGDRFSETLADIREAAVAEITVDDLPLLVTRFGVELDNLRIHVTVGEKQVQPAVVVENRSSRCPIRASAC